MGKCLSCTYFRYSAGIALSLQKLVGINKPTRPTCYCDYAKAQWERKSAEIKKPRGIKCNYKEKVEE
jgi:hypothetical protein